MCIRSEQMECHDHQSPWWGSHWLIDLFTQSQTALSNTQYQMQPYHIFLPSLWPFRLYHQCLSQNSSLTYMNVTYTCFITLIYMVSIWPICYVSNIECIFSVSFLSASSASVPSQSFSPSHKKGWLPMMSHAVTLLGMFMIVILSIPK